jgi:acetyl esterase/lipase
VVVGIHGGCWLDDLGEGSLTPAVLALTAEGIATWNVEYRRLGHSGGGWPGTFLDVGAGVDHLRTLADDFPLDLERVVLIGHSSGGHLAIWAAARPWLPEESPIRGSSPLAVAGAVGIDGPVDLARWSRAGTDVEVCGEPVIAALMGGSPDDRPERYRDASPIEMPWLGVPVYLNPAAMILGLSDPDILTRRAYQTGEIVTVVPVTNSDHFQLITPGHEAWSPVLQTIKTALGVR